MKQKQKKKELNQLTFMEALAEYMKNRSQLIRSFKDFVKYFILLISVGVFNAELNSLGYFKGKEVTITGAVKGSDEITRIVFVCGQEILAVKVGDKIIILEKEWATAGSPERSRGRNNVQMAKRR